MLIIDKILSKMLVISSERLESKSVLDSRCTFHLSHNKQWFTNIKDYSVSKVLLGNDYEY